MFIPYQDRLSTASSGVWNNMFKSKIDDPTTPYILEDKQQKFYDQEKQNLN